MGKRNGKHRRPVKGDKTNFKKIPHRNQQLTNFRSRDDKIKGCRTDWREWRYQDHIKRQLINSKGNTCALCGRPIPNMKHCTIDHIHPKVKGGLTTLENCQLAHKFCNQLKGAKSMEEWEEWKKTKLAQDWFKAYFKET